MDIFLLVAAGAALVATVLFSLAEAALLYYSPAKLGEMLGSKPSAEKIRRQLDRSDALQLIATGSVASTTAIFALLLTFLFPQKTALTFGMLFGICLVAAILAARIVSHLIVRHDAERFLLACLPLVTFMARCLAPLGAVAAPGRKAMIRLLGLREEPPIQEQVEDEILSAVHEGEREGVIQGGEKEMIEGIIDLKDEDVADIMTPRTEMFSISIDTSLAEAIRMINEAGHSRVPVYGENRDNIKGILHVKDILKNLEDREQTVRNLQQILRSPVFVPETKKIGELLTQFRRDRVHLAVVVDEYGGTAGIITIEDIIEEIVGEIHDEFDTVPLKEPILMTSRTSAVIDARLHMAELNEKLSLSLPEDEGFDTVGGFVCSLAGHVPEQKEQVVHKDVQFTVLSADDRRIHSLRITLPETREGEG